MAVNPTFGGIAGFLGLAGGEATRSRGATRRGEVRVAESYLVQVPADELYRRCRGLERLSGLLSLVEVQVVEDIPGERLAWESVPGGEVEHRGVVRLEPSPRGTRMRVEMEFRGKDGADVAKRLGPSADDRLRKDLRAFKSVAEAGDAPTVEGQPRGTCGLTGGKREGR